MPQMLHDVVYKAIIVEEELTREGHVRNPTRSTG
jgi:hypothetical protein